VRERARKKEAGMTWVFSLPLSLPLFFHAPLTAESCNRMKDFEMLIIGGTKLAAPINNTNFPLTRYKY
jgi:hypothetical protein